MNEPVDPSIYQFVVEQTRDYALFVLSPDGRILTWGNGARRMKGYEADEIIGRHFSVFYTRDAIDRAWPDYELKVAIEEGHFEDEGWRVRKDGSRFWANVVITALRDQNGKLVGFSKITRDLSQRRLTEEALRQSEERFRLMVDGVADYAIYMLDQDGIVTSWNTGAQRIKGYSREEIIGKHYSRFYAPQDIAANKPWEELAMVRKTGRLEEEGWRVRKNGERFWARVVVTALYDGSGHMRGFAKVTQDLTDRRYMKELEEASRNVSEFIAMLTHELRNPLAPIRTAVQIIGHIPNVDPALDVLHRTIDRQSGHLARILDDMMDVSRIARGKMLAFDHQVIDLTEVVRRAIEAAKPLVDAEAHQLKVDLPPKKLLVQGDFHRLTQLLTNLLTNAARYTDKGGNITVSTCDEQGSAIIRVRDNGRGIATENIERIFGMFVQGQEATQSRGGLGVGLALARKIAESHNGTLSVFSEGVNKGSEFTFKMPLIDAIEETPKMPKRVSPALESRRVLIADDNADAAESLSLLLKALGNETCVVYDGIATIEMAEKFRPDIVLLDLGMPGIDGFETARRLRNLNKHFRIVAVTGWGQQLDRQKTREAGFDLHLVKPVDEETLIDAVLKQGLQQNWTVH
ncbi:MAG: PAS domain S-box protein [Burkholderiales bacterium]